MFFGRIRALIARYWLYTKLYLAIRVFAWRRHLTGCLHDPLRVCFIGPWQYWMGLGIASQSYLIVLQHMKVPLNALPIFFQHKQLEWHETSTMPPHFEGHADVALIHLNPENWVAYLTAEAQQSMAQARFRIGLWLWECSQLPRSWLPAFSLVHAIWAPSTYCAALIRRYTNLPIHVVPYTVSLPDLAQVDNAYRRVRDMLSLSPTARIVSYIFDGSSIVARKNPQALIRAFANTTLHQQGWVLVLKTKHLDNDILQAADLRGLVQRVPGVLLVEEVLTSIQLNELMLGCDIYASSHCSEGFGLTVVEAMAAEKPVVATDYGATTDYLDDTTGYPVAYRPVTLSHTIGPYRAGSEWAQVDEDDFAKQLIQAALDVVAGNKERAQRARERIGAQLSVSAVRALMEESLQQLAEQG